ncbi:unnamed protein product [Closterium sp. NIES-64]|nr:unnamed protein product [Closterium sp. NIES-64]
MGKLSPVGPKLGHCYGPQKEAARPQLLSPRRLSGLVASPLVTLASSPLPSLLRCHVSHASSALPIPPRTTTATGAANEGDPRGSGRKKLRPCLSAPPLYISSFFYKNVVAPLRSARSPSAHSPPARPPGSPHSPGPPTFRRASSACSAFSANRKAGNSSLPSSRLPPLLPASPRHPSPSSPPSSPFLSRSPSFLPRSSSLSSASSCPSPHSLSSPSSLPPSPALTSPLSTRPRTLSGKTAGGTTGAGKVEARALRSGLPAASRRSRRQPADDEEEYFYFLPDIEDDWEEEEAVQRHRREGQRWRGDIGGEAQGKRADAERGELGGSPGQVAQWSVKALRAVKDNMALSLPPESLILVVSCLVGVLTGSSVVLFNDTVHIIRDTLFQNVPHEEGSAWLRDQPVGDVWHLFLVPLAGGIAVGILNSLRSGLKDTAPTRTQQQQQRQQQQQQQQRQQQQQQQRQQQQQEGERTEKQDGKDQTKFPKQPAFSLPFLTPDDVSELNRKSRAVARPVLKALAAAVTLGTGNSLGPEGPSVEIGSSIGKATGSIVRGSRERTIALVAAGSAAGIASGFNAAVAGCFFALESVLRSSTQGSPASLTTAMILLSSVLAAVVSQAGLGADPSIHVPLYELRSPAELPLYLLLGLCCGGVSISLTRSAAFFSSMFDGLEANTAVPPVLLPAIGGLGIGVISLVYPEVLYWGFQNVNDLITSHPLVASPAPGFLLQLVVVKVLATAFCRGSRLVGGFYAPSLFIGAALGAAYGRLASDVLAFIDPDLTLTWIQVAAPQAYAMVGMAATLAGVCQVPLTSVLLLFELTRDYRIILPLMAAVGISSWLASTAARKPRRPQPGGVTVFAPSNSPSSSSSSFPSSPPYSSSSPSSSSSSSYPYPTSYYPSPLSLSLVPVLPPSPVPPSPLLYSGAGSYAPGPPAAEAAPDAAAAAATAAATRPPYLASQAPAAPLPSYAPSQFPGPYPGALFTGDVYSGQEEAAAAAAAAESQSEFTSEGPEGSNNGLSQETPSAGFSSPSPDLPTADLPPLRIPSPINPQSGLMAPSQPSSPPPSAPPSSPSFAPFPPPPPLVVVSRDDGVSLDVRDGVFLEEQLLEELPVAVAMNTSFAAVGVRAMVRDAVASMVAHRQWCCLVLQDGGYLHGLLTLVDVQEEAERQLSAGGAAADVEALPVIAICHQHPDSEAFLRLPSESNLSPDANSNPSSSNSSGIAARSRPSEAIEVTFPDTTLRAARDRMTARGLRQLPVVLREEMVVTRERVGGDVSGSGSSSGSESERGSGGYSSSSGGSGSESERGSGSESEREYRRGNNGWGSGGGSSGSEREEDDSTDGESGSDGDDISNNDDDMAPVVRLRVLGLVDRDDISLACRAEATRRLLSALPRDFRSSGGGGSGSAGMQQTQLDSSLFPAA